MYKKLLVHQLDEETLEDVCEKSDIVEHTADGKAWKDHFETNPKLLDYGEKQAEIVDFAIIDHMDSIPVLLRRVPPVRSRQKLTFHSQVKNPIFTVTILEQAGNSDITGTNTMFERVETGTRGSGRDKNRHLYPAD